jgi:hypothetical protein
VYGRWGDIVGVCDAPVMAQVMITLRLEAMASSSLDPMNYGDVPNHILCAAGLLEHASASMRFTCPWADSVRRTMTIATTYPFSL